MKYAGNNSPEYWNESWKRGVKKFPKWATNRIIRVIPYGASVLDIGCGDGSMLYRIKREKNSDVYGIDISDYAIQFMKQTFGMLGEVLSAEDLGSFNKEFDIVIAAHIFEHVSNDRGLVTNIVRITKSAAIISVPNNCSYPEETGEHVRKYDKDSLRQLLTPHFSGIEDYTLGNHIIFKCLK